MSKEELERTKQGLMSGSMENESLHSILSALVDMSDIEEIFLLLHNIASETGVRDVLESKYEESKDWVWT